MSGTKNAPRYVSDPPRQPRAPWTRYRWGQIGRRSTGAKQQQQQQPKSTRPAPQEQIEHESTQDTSGEQERRLRRPKSVKSEPKSGNNPGKAQDPPPSRRSELSEQRHQDLAWKDETPGQSKPQPSEIPESYSRSELSAQHQGSGQDSSPDARQSSSSDGKPSAFPASATPEPEPDHPEPEGDRRWIVRYGIGPALAGAAAIVAGATLRRMRRPPGLMPPGQANPFSPWILGGRSASQAQRASYRRSIVGGAGIAAAQHTAMTIDIWRHQAKSMLLAAKDRISQRLEARWLQLENAISWWKVAGFLVMGVFVIRFFGAFCDSIGREASARLIRYRRPPGGGGGGGGGGGSNSGGGGSSSGGGSNTGPDPAANSGQGGSSSDRRS